MSVRSVYNPILLRKEQRAINRNFIYSPLIERRRLGSFFIDYAPETVTQTYNILRSHYTFSPFAFRSFDRNYSPQEFKTFESVQKYSPFSEYNSFNRYSPFIDKSLIYKPVVISKHKPQPLIITNAQTLKDYYDYLVRLLSILE
jgi:hypothetical protein